MSVLKIQNFDLIEKKYTTPDSLIAVCVFKPLCLHLKLGSQQALALEFADM